MIDSSEGTADTRNSGTREIETKFLLGKFRLLDQTRGQGIHTYQMDLAPVNRPDLGFDLWDLDNNWTAEEYDNSRKDNILFDAHWAAMMYHDYFLEVHGRNGIDGTGFPISIYANASMGELGNNNAIWADRVICGPGTGDNPAASFDVVAHEIAHGFESFTSQLGNSGDQGPMEEGLSDIWAACVTAFAAPEKAIYIFGEESDGPDRNLQAPNVSGNPDTYLGTFWDASNTHTNSTIISHWFYLLSEGDGGGGGSNDNGDLFNIEDGIGIINAAKILYRAQSQYFHPGMDYFDARTYAIDASDDIFGENSLESITVANAWYAVGVGEPIFGHLDGDDFACFNSNATIEITKFHPFESTVNWGVSPNLSIVSSNNDQVTVVASDPGFRGIGTITATYAGQQIVKEVWVGKPAFPSDDIFGSTSVPYGAIVNYSGSEVEGASSYQWLLPFPFDDPVFAYPSPDRWGIIDGGDVRHLTALVGPNNGLIQFKGVNVCGSGGAETLSVSVRTPGGGRTPNPGDPPVSEGDGIPFLNELDTDILLFPNPVRDNMTIRLSREDLKRISIFDLNGKLILSKPIEGNELSLSIPREMKDGVYVLKINGETELVRKIILNRSGN